jgi:pyruvate-ferredoxin/flavodoxin oxidoreductase
MSTALKNHKAAVDSGQWLLYRYNPAAKGTNPLTLDSNPPKLPLKDYLSMENRFKMLELTQPENAAALFEEAQRDVRARWALYEYLASCPVGHENGAD